MMHQERQKSAKYRFGLPLTFLLMVATVPVSYQISAQTHQIYSQREIQSKIRSYLRGVFSSSNARFEIEWISNISGWKIGNKVDSVTIRYSGIRLPKGYTILRVEAQRKGRVMRTMNYAVNVRVYQKVAVVNTMLAPQELIDSSQVTWKEKDITNLHGQPIGEFAKLSVLQTRRRLKKGTVLVEGDLIPLDVIQRGQIVTLLYEKEFIQIEMQVTALQDGARGEVIWFKFPDNHKRLKGEVVNNDLAVLAN